MTELTVAHATEPASPARPNEDCFVHRGNVAVLLDGAGPLVPVDSGCMHGVTWFVRQLGRHFADAATVPNGPLSAALATAIDQTARSHAESCDLANPNSPSATVIAIRVTDSHLEYLVLGDSTLIYGSRQDAHIITDLRIDRVKIRLGGTPKSDQARQHYMRELARHRNRRGGFWVAGTDLESAQHAYTGTVPLIDAPHAALMSDGASRLVDRYGLATWNDALALLLDAGPAAYLQRVRHAEASDPECTRWPRSKNHDDATVAILTYQPANSALTNLAL
jgi:hypothetical protein